MRLTYLYSLSLNLLIELRFPNPRAVIISELVKGARIVRGIFAARDAISANEWAGPPNVNELHSSAADSTASITIRQYWDDMFDDWLAAIY